MSDADSGRLRLGLIVLVVLSTIGLIRFATGGDPAGVRGHLLDAAAIQELSPDEASDTRLFKHIHALILGGREGRTWRDLADPAKHVCSTLAGEMVLAQGGTGHLAGQLQHDLVLPTRDELIAAYQAMGAEAMADLLARALPGSGGRVNSAVRQAADHHLPRVIDQVRSLRLAYVREHSAVFIRGR